MKMNQNANEITTCLPWIRLHGERVKFELVIALGLSVCLGLRREMLDNEISLVFVSTYQMDSKSYDVGQQKAC